MDWQSPSLGGPGSQQRLSKTPPAESSVCHTLTRRPLAASEFSRGLVIC